MGLTDDYLKARNSRGANKLTNDYLRNRKRKEEEDVIIAPTTVVDRKASRTTKDSDIAPVREQTETQNPFADGFQIGDISKAILGVLGGSESADRGEIIKDKWQNYKDQKMWKSHFEDGYQFGDISKTVKDFAKESGFGEVLQSVDPRALAKYAEEHNTDAGRLSRDNPEFWKEMAEKAESSEERLRYTQKYNQLYLQQSAETLANTKMDGHSWSVLREMEMISRMDNGKEKKERREAVLAKMEELGIDPKDYGLFSGDRYITWDNAGDWLGDTAMAGLAGFNKGLTATADLILGTPMKALGWEENPVSKLADYYSDEYDIFKYNSQLQTQRMGGGDALEFAAGFVEGGVAALPSAIMAMWSGGASLPATSSSLASQAAYASGDFLTRAGITTQTMAKNPQYWMSFARTYGTDFEEAKAKGADDATALLGATLSSLVNAGIEIGTDGMSGIQGLPKNVAEGGRSKIVDWAISSVQEAGEEGAQGLVNDIVSKVLYDPDAEILNPKETLTDMALGFAVGGALGGGQIATQSAVDAVQEHQASKLNETEQSVVDKVYQKLLAEEEEKNGKQTRREKDKLYNSVLEKMNKGYISIEDIEEILGGDSYTAYDNILKESEEFNTLYRTESGKLSEEQRDRLAELKERNKATPYKDAVQAAKDNLSQSVFTQVQNSRLVESYNERSRRGEAYKADLSKYDTKQQAVIQKAIDSGILNNTNRTHEAVDLIAKISADKGVLFDFTNNQRLKESGFAIDDKQVNGFVTKDGVTLNMDSPKYLNSTVGHEITHVLEGTELYTELQNTLFEYAKSKNDFDGRRTKLAELYKDIKDADIDEELTADLVGDYLFTDSDFVYSLSTEHRDIFDKIYDEIKYLCKVVTAGSKEARELERVRKSFADAYRVGNKAQTGTKYSMSEESEWLLDDELLDEELLLDESSDIDWDEILGSDWATKSGYEVAENKPRYKGDTTTKGKTAKLTDERIERLFREYGASMPNYAQAYITSIHPRDFLSLTLSDESFQKWDDAAAEGTDAELFPLDIEKLRNETQTPYLNIDTETGKVIGHEGRHRMRALLEAGVTEVPIAVYDATTKYSKKPEASMRLTSQAYRDGAVNNNFAVEVKNLIPLNAVHRTDVMAAYGGKGDIKYSLSDLGEAPKPFGNLRISPKDMLLETAPVAEDIAPVTEETKVTAPVTEETTAATEETEAVTEETPTTSLYERMRQYDERQEAYITRVAELQQMGDDISQEEFDRLIAERDWLTAEQEAINEEIRKEEEQQRVYLESLTDEDAPPEIDEQSRVDPREPGKAKPYDPFANREYEDIGRQRSVNAYQYDHPEVKPFFQFEANAMLGELRNTIKGERFYASVDYANEYGYTSHGLWTGQSRQTSPDIAYLKDNGRGNGTGYTYAEIEAGLKAIIEDNGKENNACSKRIEFLIHDRLSKGYKIYGENVEQPPNEEYLKLMDEIGLAEYSKEAFDQFMMTADENAPPVDAPVKATEAPAKTPTVEAPVVEPVLDEVLIKDKANIRGQKVMPGVKPEQNTGGRTARVLDAEPKPTKQKRNLGLKAANLLVDKGMVFENLSLETGNHELQAKWDYALPSKAEARAQYFMKNGEEDVKSLDAIRKEVGKENEQRFADYLYHVHNIDRMSLDIRFGIPNKAVFGDAVTAEVSRAKVKQYEASNPEFKEYAQDVYKYNAHLRKLLVDKGVISQETADLWQQEYPHYVPIRRVDAEGLNISVPLDTYKTTVNNPVKRAIGGNQDILPLFDTMAQRTIQTYKAIARNDFGIELKNTLGTTIENEAAENSASVDEVIDSIDAQEDLLKPGTTKANPTFTVFENGERVEFEITEDMYDALKPTHALLAHRFKGLSEVSKWRRNLLTTWNPVFALYRNPVKDIQDVLINSQHPARTYANIPNAIKELVIEGKWATEYHKNGGEQNTYFEGDTNTFKAEDNAFKKVVGMPFRAMERAGNFIEQIPRLAEYIASRKDGRSVERSMLDSARVTTNFAAGGDVTKFANSHGFTFLNASVQGASQHVRNIREAKANGLKGWVKLTAKVALAGLPHFILNDLMWDDDEEYEELSDYVKDNYYIVAKLDDGKFVRIPKGRVAAVIQDGFEQMQNLITGDDEADFENFAQLVISNLAPNNPLENNIIAPIAQTLNNETWYGEELVPTRLQDVPAAEQYDESTDSISKWLGEKLNISPYKLNYLLDQYSGGAGDVFLPMLTPEAESGDDSLAGNMLAPWKKEMVTDSVLNNQNVTDFYDLRDELTASANSMYATEDDAMRQLYMDAVGWDMSDLYKQKREIQNSDLSDATKYKQVRELQAQIDELAKEALSDYNDISVNGNYAEIGNRRFNYDSENDKWYEIVAKNSDGSDNYYYQREQEITKALGISLAEYWNNRDEYSFAYDKPEQYAIAQVIGGYDAYLRYYGDNPYKPYYGELSGIKADKDREGNSISGTRKDKIIDYLNEIDADYGAKLILFKSQYPADHTYNYEIIDYLNGLDISYEQTETILKELGFEVDAEGNISWRSGRK